MSIELESFSLPLARPLETATGTIERREGFLVRSDRGVGEATPLPGFTETLEECERALERATGEESPADQLAAVAETPAARHGVVVALADERARLEGVPLCVHLDDLRTSQVPVNATIGDCEPSETAAAVEAAIDAGFSCCKVKIGRRSVTADLERLERARAVAPDVTLRVDANGAWDVETARAALEELASLDISLLEQPLPAAALEEHASLRGTGVAIALDEGLCEWGVDAILERDVADALVVKPMALGGVDRAVRIASRAQAAELDVIVSGTVDGVVARLAALHLAATIPDPLPAGLATADRLASDLGTDPAPVVDGEMTVPEGPGLGLSADWRDPC